MRESFGKTDNKTLRITQGALLCAIFAAFVLLNRQTAGVLQFFIIYIYALPITIYTSWYGLKVSAAAVVAMVLLSFLLGTPTYAFYSCTSVAIGVVFGECLYKKVPAEKTILWVMMTSIIVNLLDLAFMKFVMGISLSEEVLKGKEQLDNALEQYGSSLDENTIQQFDQLFTVEAMRTISLIAAVMAGVLQGFLTYLIGSLVMRKLGVKIPKPKSFTELRPPTWTGYIAMIGYIVFNMILTTCIKDEVGKNQCMIIGTIFYIYLLIFGVVGGYLLLYKYLTRSKAFAIILSIIATLIIPFLVMIVGFIYLVKPGGIFTLPEWKKGNKSDNGDKEKLPRE